MTDKPTELGRSLAENHRTLAAWPRDRRHEDDPNLLEAEQLEHEGGLRPVD